MLVTVLRSEVRFYMDLCCELNVLLEECGVGIKSHDENALLPIHSCYIEI